MHQLNIILSIKLLANELNYSETFLQPLNDEINKILEVEKNHLSDEYKTSINEIETLFEKTLY